MQNIEIWAPRYKDRKVLIAKYKVGNNNLITFTKAKHLAGMKFTIKGEEIVKYPLETNRTVACYAVPLDKLEKIKE